MQSSLKETDLETKMFDSSFDTIKSAKEVSKPEVNFVERNRTVKKGPKEKKAEKGEV